MAWHNWPTYCVVGVEMDGRRDVLEENRTGRDAARLQTILYRSKRYHQVLVEEEAQRQPPPDP